MGILVRGRLWIGYVAAALSVVGAYYATGQTAVIFHLIGLSAAVAILVGVRVHRPSHRLPWLLFALGQLLFVAGDVLSYNYEKFFGTELPYPAISDVFYLLVYPCLVAGLLLILRRRSAGRDRGSLVDSAMFAIGIGIVSWVLLIAPYVHDTVAHRHREGSRRWPTRSWTCSCSRSRCVWPRVRAARPPRSTSSIVGVAALFITDAIYGWMLLNNGYTPGAGSSRSDGRSSTSCSELPRCIRRCARSRRRASKRSLRSEPCASDCSARPACWPPPSRPVDRSRRELRHVGDPRRDDRAVHAGRRPDGWPRPPAGAVDAPRARATRGGVGAGDRDQPRRHLRRDAGSGEDRGRRARRAPGAHRRGRRGDGGGGRRRRRGARRRGALRRPRGMEACAPARASLLPGAGLADSVSASSSTCRRPTPRCSSRRCSSATRCTP